MNKKLLATLVAVLVIAIALFVWHRGRSQKSQSAPTAAAPAEKLPPTPKRMKHDTPPPQPPPQATMDDDPVGNLRLEGQVLDADDSPVEGATVTISSNPSRTAKTEGDGSFSFDKLVGRTYVISARAGNQIGGPLMHKLTATSDPAVLRLHAGGKVVVTVVDPEDAPISGATVELRSNDLQTEVTGGDGIARFDGVPTGFLALVAHAPAYGPTRQLVQVPDSAGAPIETRVVLHPGAPVSGKVVDQQNRPIADARVIPVDTSKLFSLASGTRDAAVTDKKGRFTLPALAAGSYRLAARHPDHAPGSSDAIAVDGSTPVTDVVITLAAGGVVEGKVVTADQKPAPWAAVRIGGDVDSAARFGDVDLRQVTADEHGEFVMRGLARAHLAAVAIAENASSEVVKLDLTSQQKLEGVVIVLGIDGGISGKVVDSAGNPVAEAQVTALPDFLAGAMIKDFRLRGLAAATTDGGGAFALRGLPDGTYRLRASRSSIDLPAMGLPRDPGTQAATGDTGVVLTLARTGGIKGRVNLQDGSAPSAFTVTVGFPPGTPFANRTGDFEVDSLPPGKFDVTVRGPAFADRTIPDVVVSEGEVTDLRTVTVSAGRSVTGRVLDGSGQPVAGASVIVALRLLGDGRSAVTNLGSGADESMGIRRDRTDDQGAFRVRGISSTKEQVLIAEHDVAGRSLPVTIPPGNDDPSYDLVLHGYGSLVGTVKLGDQPGAGLTVVANAKDVTNHGLVVTTGPAGNYRFERIPEGEYRIIAVARDSGSVGGGTTGTATAMIQVGQESRADITIPLGNIMLRVVLQGAGGAKVENAQLWLFPNQVQAATLAEMMEASKKQVPTATGAALGGNPGELTKLQPGHYTLCVLPLAGDLNDPTVLQRLQANAMTLKIYCQPVVIQSSPATQTYTAVVPPMDPLPDPPPAE